MLPLWISCQLAFSLVAIAALTAALWRDLQRPYQPPVFIGFAAIIFYYNWPITLELWLGQCDMLVLASLALAAWLAVTSKPQWSGIALAVAALIKTLPGTDILWLFRRHCPSRLRTLTLTLITGCAALVSTLVVFGPPEILRWINATFAAREQPLVSFSVWGLGRHLFTETINMEPLANSGVAAWVITILALGVVTTLLIVVLIWPGDSRLSLWHVACCTTLLLPIAHLEYYLLVLPIVLIWFARVINRSSRNALSVAMFLLTLCWWYVTFRHIWPGNTGSTISTAGFVAIMTSTLVCISCSVVIEARTAFHKERRSAKSPTPGFAEDPLEIQIANR